MKPILFGSHIDSVLSGGNFDGDVGSMSAVEVLHTLKEHGVTTRHPLQMVIWTDEENTFAGSGAAAGLLSAADLKHINNGISTADGIRKLGGDPTRLADARLVSGAIRCYLGFRIEQGGVLDKAKVPIGVVEGIVCIDRYEVEIHGFANHAGTTPDAGTSQRAARSRQADRSGAERSNPRTRAASGRGWAGWKCHLTRRNVVPGTVKHSIELRDLSAEKIAGSETGNSETCSSTLLKETGTEIVDEESGAAPRRPWLARNPVADRGRGGRV